MTQRRRGSTQWVLTCFGLLGAACGHGGSSSVGFDSTDAGVGDDGSAPSAPSALGDGATGPAVCGDNVCSPGESCISCPNDCGQCPACNLAPSCSQGLALPSQPSTVSFAALSAPMPPPGANVDAGAEGGVDVDGGLDADGSTGGGVDASAPLPNNCNDAQLRLRLSRIEVGHQGQEIWLPTGTISGPAQSYYCIMQASDGAVVSAADAGNNTVEVAITKPTALINDFEGADFGPLDSIFWGQTGPRLTQGNLTVTYSCFRQKQPGSNSWQTVLNAAGMAAGSLAGAGPYGWAFGVAGVALQTVAAAVGAAQQQGDVHLFDVTQTIDQSWLLNLTNGRVWSFTQSADDKIGGYPWSLTAYIESWGCADPKATGSK